MERTRSWCFTLNNYTECECTLFDELGVNKQVRYLIYGREVGEKETPHLQGFIVFHNAKTFSQVRKIMGERVHIEKTRGSAKQNIAYCTKDDNYVEFGEPPCQGSRSDIQDVKDQVLSNVPLNEIVMSTTSYQSARHAELLYKYQSMPPPMKRTIRWYYGSTGTGKTRTAVEESGGDCYITMRDLRWWDGYFGQKYVIVDDFRKDFCTFHELLRIVDRYPYRVNIKGSSLWFQPTTQFIIFTSCYHPSEVYSTREDVEQLIRRIDEIREFK